MGVDGREPGEDWVRQCAAFPGFYEEQAFSLAPEASFRLLVLTRPP
jgi:hypothetical protein